MKELPESKIYEQEMIYMPYKKSLKGVTDTVYYQAPNNGCLLDIMCGPGYLLGQIAARRKDLSLTGMDIDKRYIIHAKKKYPKINFEIGDILSWQPKQLFDLVICTGSLHHIPYEKQAQTIKRISSMVKPGGFCIISDCHIDDYANEQERKIAAAKLGYEYLQETVKNGAPKEVIAATIDILHNDVMKNEFKTSLKKRLPILKKIFGKIKLLKTWPDFQSGYGDYILVCRAAKNLNARPHGH